MRTLLGIVGLLALSSSHASTFDVVIAGKKCAERDSQQLDCDYRVGNDLWVTVAGIGQDDTAVTFMKASFDGDYYATFGLMHACVIVKPGKKTQALSDFAFISPRTGKVFRSWHECQAN